MCQILRRSGEEHVVRSISQSNRIHCYESIASSPVSERAYASQVLYTHCLSSIHLEIARPDHLPHFNDVLMSLNSSFKSSCYVSVPLKTQVGMHVCNAYNGGFWTLTTSSKTSALRDHCFTEQPFHIVSCLSRCCTLTIMA